MNIKSDYCLGNKKPLSNNKGDEMTQDNMLEGEPNDCCDYGVFMSRSTVAIANELCKALEDLSFDCYEVFGTTAPSIATYNKTFDVLERCRNELKSHNLPRAESIDDAMMDLVDRLGSEYDKVDPRSWRHLLIYAPKEDHDDNLK